MRVTLWRRLIRRSRLEVFVRDQAEQLDRQGAEQAAFAFRQLAENLRTGMSLSVKEESNG